MAPGVTVWRPLGRWSITSMARYLITNGENRRLERDVFSTIPPWSGLVNVASFSFRVDPFLQAPCFRARVALGGIRNGYWAFSIKLRMTPPILY